MKCIIVAGDEIGEEGLIMQNRIRELRKSRNMTMKQLGEVVGVAESTISQYETGKRQPDNETVLKLGEFFDVTVGYILGAEKERATIDVIDDDLKEYLDELRNRPEKKLLFSVTKNATKSQIEAIVRMIEEMQGN